MSRIILALCLATAACSSYADRVSATCSRFGAGPGTSHYWDCIQQQQAIDAQDRAGWANVTATRAGLMAPAPTFVVVPRY